MSFASGRFVGAAMQIMQDVLAILQSSSQLQQAATHAATS